MHEQAPQLAIIHVHFIQPSLYKYMADTCSIYQHYPMHALFMLILSFSFVPCMPCIIIHNTTILNCVGCQRPLITQSPGNITIAARHKAELECKASGKPAPNFQWLKDGGDVAGSTGVTITTGNGHSTLTINNTHKSHAGEYRCRAFNCFRYRDDISCPATITVAGELSMSSYTDLSILSSPQVLPPSPRIQ